MHDNPALHGLITKRVPVIPLFTYHAARHMPPVNGEAQKVWLDGSLRALNESLRKRGSRLIVKTGEAQSLLPALLKQWNAAGISWNALIEPEQNQQDRQLARTLSEAGCNVEIHRDAQTLFAPDDITTQEGDYYRVFTPFWKRCMVTQTVRRLYPAPDSIPAPLSWPPGDALDLLPRQPDWSEGIRNSWQAGEEAARERLHHFRGMIESYPSARDMPALQATSRLSPHLHFGEISPHTVWHEMQKMGDMETAKAKFLSEVGWREFSYHLLARNPELTHACFRPEFRHFPWKADHVRRKAWQKGRTGYPIVDAGMRELWHTGWMHNRVRMIAASFFTKHLLQPWQDGAAWFLDTLVDASLANNSASWQWVAGCGADAAPYFRIFNPVLQGEKFDPRGAYIRRWVPELARLPDAYIHKPWKAPPLILHEAGIVLGKHYPEPVVDHDRARQEALAAFEHIKKAA